MQNKRIYIISLCLSICLLLVFQVALAEDGRINQVHHFGGDALYCDEALGCWLLDMNGNLLWEVSQATIDAAMETACQAGMTQFIDAGMGTYGPSVIEVSCYEGYDPFLTLVGYDEWGKINEMEFAPNYVPVGPPVKSDSEPAEIDLCSIPTGLSVPLRILCPL